MTRMGKGFLAALAGIVVALALMVGAASAQADFGVKAFDGQVTADQAGDAYTQAGGHPYEAWSAIAFNGHPSPAVFGLEVADADVKTISVDLPPGLVGNPSAVPKCSRTQFFSPGPALRATACPPATQVGLTSIESLEGIKAASAVWNLTPSPGSPATFGFQITGVRVLANASVRTGSDYGITLTFPNINQGLPILGTQFALWGNPSESSHDVQRCALPDAYSVPVECHYGEPGDLIEGPNSVSNANPEPFITNPTACTPDGVGLRTDLTANSWQDPDTYVSDSFTSHLPPAFPAPAEAWGPPQGPTNCAALPFAPRITVVPTSTEAAAPTGLAVELSLPQDGLRDPDGLATADLKKAVVTLPAGMTVNPATADGLGGCTEAQVALHSPGAAACPESSRIGTVSIDTPLLERELEGGVYLATEGTNPFNSLLALYVVAEDEKTGVVIKLAGKVSPDPVTGQLVAEFDENPQLPFEELHLNFNGGERAPLVNPAECGAYTTHAELSSWARPGEPVGSDSRFTIDQGCGKAAGFTPGLEAGTRNPSGGQFSAFTLRVTRPDGQQNLASIQATLPEGLLAKLVGVPLCPEAQAGSGDCPAASQVGSVTVGAGSGPDPVYVPEAGKAPTGVYLAGPYRGAPYSLVVKVPAQAGPFDLGTVTVRNGLYVDPVSTQVTTRSDPLPQILQGIPVSYRDVRVEIDRPQFTVNPTDCEPTEVTSTLVSAAGAVATPSTRFQAANCASLEFGPKLALRLSGAPPRRGANPALRATVTPANGDANIGKASVILPATELLEQGHIKTVCTRVQFAAGQCPTGSIYGHAEAWTPLLDQALEGPVYLRSNGGERKLPDLVADLNGQIHVVLVGYIDSVKRHGSPRIRTRFLSVPDAPVSRFVLEMQKGRKSLLANTTNLCKAKPRAEATLGGQNGKADEARPLVKVDGCGGKAHKKSKGHKTGK